VDEGTLTNGETKDIAHKPRQPLEADAVHEPQIAHLGAQIGSEGRSGLHLIGRRGFELLSAARTNPAMQRDTCHFWFDRRDFVMIITLAGKLWQAANIASAMLPVADLQIELGRWVRMNWTMRARVRLLLRLRGCLARCLPALARGRAGIVRGLWRLTEFLFKLAYTCTQGCIRRPISPIEL
jgi:hypothetical protein